MYKFQKISKILVLTIVVSAIITGCGTSEKESQETKVETTASAPTEADKMTEPVLTETTEMTEFPTEVTTEPATETAPVETKPKATEPTPVETKPAPTEPAPVETKPVPTEPAPVETKPAPTEPEPPVETSPKIEEPKEEPADPTPTVPDTDPDSPELISYEANIATVHACYYYHIGVTDIRSWKNENPITVNLVGNTLQFSYQNQNGETISGTVEQDPAGNIFTDALIKEDGTFEIFKNTGVQ